LHQREELTRSISGGRQDDKTKKVNIKVERAKKMENALWVLDTGSLKGEQKGTAG